MFRLLARLLANPAGTTAPTETQANQVFGFHPLQLSRWVEDLWAGGGLATWPTTTNPAPLGDPNVVNAFALPAALRTAMPSGIPVGPMTAQPWDHLMFAYLVESTGVAEILTEVVRRYAAGETIEPPQLPTLVWARATEELFLREPSSFHIGFVASHVRPDARVNRRNAYWRMFGLDLPHPVPGQTDAASWKRDAGSVANTRFLELWNELLRQTWMGIENDNNQVGANPTDSGYIGYLCQTLSEMLQMRRRGGMLAREEFAYVAFMHWCFLTVEFDTTVVRDLSARAGTVGNPADRLAAIGARVGITPARATRELFDLADLISPLMWAIELGVFNSASNAKLLYESFGMPNPPIPTMMTRIIDLWQSATGERVKDKAVAVRSGALMAPAQPTRLPSGPALAASTPMLPISANGRR